MPTAKSAIAVTELLRRLGGPTAPLVFDVRRRPAFEAAERLLASARWRDPDAARDWGRRLPEGAECVVYCVHGHEVGQAVAAELQALGRRARFLEGGFEAVLAAGGPTLAKAARPPCDEGPSAWVTRERPKVDRIACPWLIRRFVDPDAVIHYVAPERVVEIAGALGAVPFDVDGVDYSHDGARCSFDSFLGRLDLKDPALDHLARIVRGADTARLELEPECAGLLALALGTSAAWQDDKDALAAGIGIYDALYAWIRFARAERHNWPATPPAEAAA